MALFCRFSDVDIDSEPHLLGHHGKLKPGGGSSQKEKASIEDMDVSGYQRGYTVTRSRQASNHGACRHTCSGPSDSGSSSVLSVDNSRS